MCIRDSAYADLRDMAARQRVEFRFESTVMDGAPVFNLVRYNLPGVTVLGFTGALNSTSKLVIETMERGGSFEDGLALARSLGVTEADASFDVEGWAVSYTHLDVYKRQRWRPPASTGPAPGAGMRSAVLVPRGGE